jgi:taurine dioxygenase
MNLKLRRLSHALGAEVLDIDLRQPLSPDRIAEIRAAWMQHQVLLFRDQAITPAQQIRFTEQFGPVDDYPLVHFRHPDHPQLMVLSSDPGTGSKSTSRAAGERWHTDLSFTTRPATASMLHAQKIPSIGGDTMFANQYLAYEALSPTLQQVIEPLETVHELFSGRADFKALDVTKMLEMRAANPPVAQPMVRVHPETGRPALYVSPSLSSRIVGMTTEESAGLLAHIKQVCVNPQIIYRHQWRVGDLLIWDNRCLLHIAVQDYDKREHRLMYRTTITGAPCGRLLEEAGSALPSPTQVAVANS